MYGKVIPCYSWYCRAHTTTHKLLWTDYSIDGSVLHSENVIWVGKPFSKYPELTAPQPRQFCVLKDCDGIRQHGQEAHIRLWTLYGQPYSLLSCHKVAASGLCLGHPSNCHLGAVAAGNQEDPWCLFWWSQEEGKSEVIKKGSFL